MRMTEKGVSRISIALGQVAPWDFFNAEDEIA